jgi:CBS domain-containing protein
VAQTTPEAQSRPSKPRRNGQNVRVTAGHLCAFTLLTGTYGLLLWFLTYLGMLSGLQPAWAIFLSLVVILVLGAASGIGYSRLILEMIGATDIVKRLGGVSVLSLLPSSPDSCHVREDAKVQAARTCQQRADNGLVPVVNGEGQLTGIVTAADLVAATEHQTVRDVMTNDPVVAYADNSVAELYRTMVDTDHSRIPIVERATGQYLGTVTARQVLEAIGQPS